MNATLVRRVERLERFGGGDGPGDTWVRYVADWRDPANLDGALDVNLTQRRAYTSDGSPAPWPEWLR